MTIEIRPPFELDKDAWQRFKEGLWRSLLALAGVVALAVGLVYLIDWLVRLLGGYEGSI